MGRPIPRTGSHSHRVGPGVLAVPNELLLATCVASLIILGIVVVRMRRNELAGTARSANVHLPENGGGAQRSGMLCQQFELRSEPKPPFVVS